MRADAATEVEVRDATRADRPAILALLQASLGWVPDDQYSQFFSWKHHENPFGASPAWVAVEGGEIVGFRTFMRWELVRDGTVVRTVRAVDTATHPDAQGRGIFSLLTRHALASLADDGVAFVFNTPNDRSRPGYLKMGWQLVERLPVAARPRSVASLVRLARARTPADKWSAPSMAGIAVPALLNHHTELTELIAAAIPEDGRLRTHRTPEHFGWRYGFPALHYRAMPAESGVADGVAIFRLRRRGAALEAAICELLTPPGDRGERHALVRRVLRETGADHAVMIGAPDLRHGLLPVPGQGPTLVWRGVREAEMPLPDRWDLGLGDIELF